MYIVTHKFTQHVKKNQFFFLRGIILPLSPLLDGDVMEVLQRQELSQSCGQTQALLRPGERRVEILFHRWQDGCFRLAEARKCTRGTSYITVLGWRKMARLQMTVSTQYP
jgi:hypothetical protein